MADLLPGRYGIFGYDKKRPGLELNLEHDDVGYRIIDWTSNPLRNGESPGLAVANIINMNLVSSAW